MRAEHSPKRALRHVARAERDALGAAARAAADAAIAHAVVALPEFARARTLLAYLSFGSEVETRPIIAHAWEQGKLVALPRCASGTRTLCWHVVDTLDGLLANPYGIDEPDPARHAVLAADERDGALALVPGLAFDARGFRLGYGGGYYDAFLSGFGGTSVGLCRAAQLRASLRRAGAVEPHDVAVQLVVTEARTLRTPAFR